MVEDARGKIDSSCSMEPRDGLDIRTNTARLLRYRRMILELLLAAHECDCTVCSKSGSCRLQMLAHRYGVKRVRFEDTRERLPQDESSYAIVRNPNKCILCGDCVRVCREIQGMGILDFVNRGSEARVRPAFNEPMIHMIRLAARHKIADRFHFTGFMKGEQVYEVFKASDVYVMPSVSEPFGISPLEAMQCGVPSIISKQSGCAEILDYAIKVDYWDIDAMADAMHALIAYPELHTFLRDEGLREVNNIKWETAGQKVRDIYNKVTGR